MENPEPRIPSRLQYPVPELQAVVVRNIVRALLTQRLWGFPCVF
jgi:hypothetical protein